MQFKPQGQANHSQRLPCEVSRLRRGFGWLLMLGCLLGLGVCLYQAAPSSFSSGRLNAATETAPTEQPQDRLLTRPICDVRPGMRALANNPELAGLLIEPLEIDPDEWRLIVLQMQKADGDRLDIELLRPLLWLQLTALERLLDSDGDDDALEALLDRLEDEAGLRTLLVGSTIELDLEELGAAGPAELLKIAPCPEIEQGEGRIVTGTFHHTAGNVIDLHVTSLAEPIGTTDTHPFWSEDRQAFIPAGDLRLSEQLHPLIDSQVVVTAIVPRASPQPVYNLEVEGEHVYYVTQNGLLVHNNGCMKVTGYTKSGDPRVHRDWRARHGPGSMRNHHLIPQELLKDPRFTSQMTRLRKDPTKFVHRQIARIANGDHVRLHAGGYNQLWKDWLSSNPRFTMQELLAQMKKMRKDFNISAGSLGQGSY